MGFRFAVCSFDDEHCFGMFQDVADALQCKQCLERFYGICLMLRYTGTYREICPAAVLVLDRKELPPSLRIVTGPDTDTVLHDWSLFVDIKNFKLYCLL